MKLFIDTAIVEEIREIAAWGVLSGVTTNPSLIAKSGRDFVEVIGEIADIVDGPISAEVTSDDVDGMVFEAAKLAAIHPNIVVKIPMTPAGLEAVSKLSKQGIHTNVTLVFSAAQALLAARAGASYVSPFVGRIDDTGAKGMQLIDDVAQIFALHDISTEIITASVRTIDHVIEAALAGSHIATIPYRVFKQMVAHPLTTSGIAQFTRDWNTYEGRAK